MCKLSRVCLLGVLLLCGCGQEAKIKGHVTLDGEPLPTGTVCFVPVGEGPVGYGMLDSNGNYTIQVGSNALLPAGDYVVTIVATIVKQPTKPGVAPPAGDLLTPAKYGNKETTDLKCTVKAGSNTFDWALKSK